MIPPFVLARWDVATDIERDDAHAVTLAVALFLFHYAIYSWWYVEDAAISFAFARNIAEGHGPVAYPGGLRVEGFSNPSWTLIMAGFALFGVTPFVVAKWLGALFGAATFPFALRLMRTLVPTGPVAYAALVLLAVSPQFVEWAGSGLENSLLVLLLTIGAVRAVEGEPWTAPWSAAVWFGLAITRPEGVAYGALLGALQLVLTALRAGPLEALRWTATALPAFLVPFAVWHAARFGVFGFPFPNTYYAKLGVDKFDPLAFNGKGWRYVRGFLLESGIGFVLPAYALLAGGAQRRALWVLGGLTALAALFVIPGIGFLTAVPYWPFTAPSRQDAAYMVILTYGWWEWMRAGALLVLIGAVTSASVLRPGGGTRAVLLATGGFALFFALYSGGDWMRGYRWFSPAIVPLAILLTDAGYTLFQALDARGYTRMRWWALAYVLGVPIAVSAGESVALIGGPETMPYDVHRRVLYMQGVQRRMALDRVQLMEVDMGAHMWWSGFEVIDMAGLVDVPMGHHKWEKPFVRTYVFGERKPEFAHVHDSWAKKTKMLDHPEFRAQYVEIDPFPTSQYRTHTGNHVRRDLLFAEDWPWDDSRTATFAGGYQLVGLYTPVADVHGGLYVELGLRRSDKGRDARAVVFLSGNGRVIAWDAPPAYDWIFPTQWRLADVAIGKHTFDLRDLPEGTYDLGVVLFDGNDVLAATSPNPEPAFAAGEVRWGGAVRVVSRDVAVGLANAGLAGGGECELSVHRYSVARRHLDRDDAWHEVEGRAARTGIARCFAARARASAGDNAISAIRLARWWDSADAEVTASGAVIAEARAKLAESAGPKSAWPLYRDALVADPTRSDLYAAAEAARDRSLGLVKEEIVVVDEGGGD